MADEERDGVPLTHLDQPLFDGADATKRDLVDYLDAMGDRILPVLRDRALSRDEIEQRWPFALTGSVTDDAGRPMPGVEIVVHSGVGTLFQVARAWERAAGTDRKHPAIV